MPPATLPAIRRGRWPVAPASRYVTHCSGRLRGFHEGERGHPKSLVPKPLSACFPQVEGGLQGEDLFLVSFLSARNRRKPLKSG